MKEQQEKYNLPEGWIWTTIDEIGIVVSGGTPSTKNKEFWLGNIPWITPADLSDYKEKSIAKGSRNISQLGLDYSSAKLIPKGSVLFSSRAPIGYVVIAQNNLTTSQGFKNLIPMTQVDSEYIYYYFLTLKTLAEKVASGTTFLELSANSFSKLPFPLCPLKEQRLIVSQIELLFSKLEEAEKRLKRADRQILVYYQVLLKNAFNGTMTKTSRNNPFSSSPTPKEIIEQDLTAKKKYWIDKKVKDLKKQNKNFKVEEVEKKYRQPLPVINPTLIVPKEWEVTNWENICNWITYGFTKKISHVDKGFPIVTGKNVINNKLDFSDVHHIGEGEYSSLSEKDLPNIGDMLVTKDGTLGRVALVDKDKFCISQSVAVIWLRSTIMNKSFLLHYMQTPYVQSWIKANAKGSTIKHLSISDLPKLEIPVPDLNEQNEIIKILESQNTLLDNLSKSISDVLTEVIAIKRSILKKAFEGRLVNHTSNESLENLLREIQEDKKIYLEDQKKLNHSKPKQKKQMEKKKSILEILKESNSPISAHELWERSTSDGDIERFYSEIKEIYDQIDELKLETESLLTLKDEDK